jgi:hypothetical protein
VDRKRNPFVTALELIAVFGIMGGAVVCVVAGFILSEALVDARHSSDEGLGASTINGIAAAAVGVGVGGSLVLIGLAAVVSYLAFMAVRWTPVSQPEED